MFYTIALAWMSDMNMIVENDVLLTGNDVRRWQEELQKYEADKASAEIRIAEIRRKLEAAALLSGARFPQPSLTENCQSDENQETMGDAAKRLLAGLDSPVFHQVLQTELRKIPRFREMLDKNAGAYYYTVIKRLVERGDIKKIGKRIRLVRKNEAPAKGTPESAS
jgi:hypothetical protein